MPIKKTFETTSSRVEKLSRDLFLVFAFFSFKCQFDMSYILFVGDLFWGKSSNNHRKIGCPPAVQCDEVLKVQRMLLSAR